MVDCNCLFFVVSVYPFSEPTGQIVPRSVFGAGRALIVESFGFLVRLRQRSGVRFFEFDNHGETHLQPKTLKFSLNRGYKDVAATPTTIFFCMSESKMI